MQIGWHDVVGNAGVLCIVGCYLLLQLEKIDSRSLKFSLINLVGAGLILISLSVEFNLAAAMIEIFWVIISLIGVGRYWRNRLVVISPRRFNLRHYQPPDRLFPPQLGSTASR